jgi:Zinc-binding dehydrogenase
VADAERGALRVVLSDTLPVSELATAHTRLEQGGLLGKLSIQVAGGFGADSA